MHPRWDADLMSEADRSEVMRQTAMVRWGKQGGPRPRRLHGPPRPCVVGCGRFVGSWSAKVCGDEDCRRRYNAARQNEYRRTGGFETPAMVAARLRAARARRARLRGAIREPYDDVDIFERDGWECQLCGAPVDRALSHPDPMCASIDHRIPLSAGGADTPANVQLAHLRCNIAKGRR